MIAAHQLTKRYGRIVAVDGIDFSIAPGRVVGFLGTNGAGKSTTIRMITGYLAPSAGSVTVDGIDVQRDPLAIRRLIGYLPESTPLYTEMRVGEFLRFRARLYGLGRRTARQAVDGAAARCWVRDVLKRPIHTLSKGYRQRVGLAAALVHGPQVLILDEPTVGLDPGQIREVRDLIRELAGEHTVVLSTHILAEAERTCDEIMVFKNGRIEAHGSIGELRSGPARTTRFEIETDAEDAAKVLSAVAGVAAVERSAIADGWTRFVVRPTSRDADLRELLARALAEHGAIVRDLRRREVTLEQLFMDMVMGEAPTGGTAGGSGGGSAGGTSSTSKPATPASVRRVAS